MGRKNIITISYKEILENKFILSPKYYLKRKHIERKRNESSTTLTNRTSSTSKSDTE